MWQPILFWGRERQVLIFEDRDIQFPKCYVNSAQVYYSTQNPSENSSWFLSKNVYTIMLFFAGSWTFGWWREGSLSRGARVNQNIHCHCRQNHLRHSLPPVSLLSYHLILVTKTRAGSTVSGLAPDCLAAVTSNQSSQISLHSAASRMIRWVCKLLCTQVYCLPTVHPISIQENLLTFILKITVISRLTFTP